MIINLHLGFPKTATTTLQNTVFPAFSGVRYFGKGDSKNTNQSIWMSLKECWDQFKTGGDLDDSLDAWLQAVFESGSEKALLSDEALMQWHSPRSSKASRWFTLLNPRVDQLRSGPHPVNDFLSTVIRRLPDGDQLRAIITVRNQADLMGSLAAQTGTMDPYFVERVLKTEDPSLSFYGIVKDLQATLGMENLLILFYEDGLEINSKIIADFIGAEIRKNTYDESTRLNVKRLGDGVWESIPTVPTIITHAVEKINETALGASLLGYLKRIAPWVPRLIPKFTRTVNISSDQRQRIQSHFRLDNDQLSELVGRDLRQLGY